MKQSPDDVFAIDPQRFQSGIQTGKEAPFLPHSYDFERIALVNHVIRDLRDHPPAERHPRTGARVAGVQTADRTWHRIRQLPVRPDGKKTVDMLLSHNNGNVYTELIWLISFLLDARERRAELLKQAEALEPIARAFAALDDEGATKGAA